ncbi:P-loop NTPase family protein [Sporosarcina gallistercoris]|uniref:Topology modulation protein n=1 Tax=Sporosarcina gallistercoris TaxID=2762245 RepID=A0ABR8PMS2_9BACL|nr:topology modulation protein [Sporosarcina gallistercoris]MBD7909483.1 topology modulation protein [Sporosarcina gallistercoris]
MRRILVMGVSAGAGKSTFARNLGEILDYPVTFLDSLYFEPGWQEVPSEVFEQRQLDATAGSTWIIEGNYSRTVSVRETNADTVIYLELPLYLCLFRVLKRRIRYHKQTRPDMGKECREKLDWVFLKYIVTTYRRRRVDMRSRMRNYTEEGKNVFLLQSRRQIREFLQMVERTQIDELH